LIERAQQHIDSQWNQPIDMKQLAASLQLSYRHFRRLFQRATGVPPGQYLLNLRVNRAKRLLAESRPVAEVAEQSGFSDPYYFSRVFKQKTGIPPARWRT
jgi:transcriptional regulator GlxA family with amidase domain